MQVWCDWQVTLCDPHLSALEVRFSRRCAIQIDVYLTLPYLVVRRERMENAYARGAAPGSGAASRKSSTVVVIAQNDIAEIKVRKQSSNLLAQQLQQQLILQQRQHAIRRDQVFSLLSLLTLQCSE